MNLKEDYNKWQLIEKEGLGNNEAYQFTKSELLDFAQYVVNKNIPNVVCRSNKCMSCEVEIKKDEGLLFCCDCGI